MESITINDTELTTSQIQDLQVNILTEKVDSTTNSKMVYNTAARKNKGINPEILDSNVSVVNVINRLSENTVAATNNSTSALNICSDVQSTVGILDADAVAEVGAKIGATDLLGMISKLYDMIKALDTGTAGDTPDMTGYAKLSDLEDLVTAAQLKEVSDAIPSTDGFITTAALDGYAKTADIPSLDGYAKTADIPSLEGYVTADALTDVVHSSDIEGMLTASALDGYAKTTDIPSLDGYAKTADYADVLRTGALTGYAKTSDLDDVVRTSDISDVVRTSTLNSYITTEALEEKLSNLKVGPKFKVVETLPTTDIDESVIYIVRNTESTDATNQFDEYYFVNNGWEKLGSFAPSVDDETSEIIVAHVEED